MRFCVDFRLSPLFELLASLTRVWVLPHDYKLSKGMQETHENDIPIRSLVFHWNLGFGQSEQPKKRRFHMNLTWSTFTGSQRITGECGWFQSPTDFPNRCSKPIKTVSGLFVFGFSLKFMPRIGQKCSKLSISCEFDMVDCYMFPASHGRVWRLASVWKLFKWMQERLKNTFRLFCSIFL